jgi:glucokinase
MGKVLALDLGGTKIYSALVEREGKIIREDIRPTMSDGGFSLVADRILDSLYSVMLEGEHPAGVGVAVPAYIDPKTDTIIFSPNLKWHNVDLKKKLEDALGLPVWLENDANLAALGEHRYGSGKSYQDMVYITVSTGVGGGLILGGKIYGGAFGGAGEFGHMIVDVHGPECSCKNRGCLEGLASGCAIKRDAQQLVKSGKGRHMLFIAGSVEKIDARVVGKAAIDGDKEAQAVLANAGRYLGIAIANVANLLNPGAFIIGGGVACGVGDLILDPARHEAYQRTYPPYRAFLKIIPAALRSQSGILGAAAFAMDQLEPENDKLGTD